VSALHAVRAFLVASFAYLDCAIAADRYDRTTSGVAALAVGRVALFTG
jgi:hypothetical protein